MPRQLLIVMLLAVLTLPAQAVRVDPRGPGTATQAFQRNQGGAAISAGDVIASMASAVSPTATGTRVPPGEIQGRIDTTGPAEATSRLRFAVVRQGALQTRPRSPRPA